MADDYEANDSRLDRFKRETVGLRPDQLPTARRYIFVHSRLNEETTAELDEIVEFLSRDKESRRLVETPGRPDGVRFALGLAVQWVREKMIERSTAERKEPAGG